MDLTLDKPQTKCKIQMCSQKKQNLPRGSKLTDFLHSHTKIPVYGCPCSSIRGFSLIHSLIFIFVSASMQLLFSAVPHLCQPVQTFIADHSIHTSKNVCPDTQNHCILQSKQSCRNRQRPKRIERRLPCIAGRITNSDSSNHADIRIHGFRKDQI